MRIFSWVYISSTEQLYVITFDAASEYKSHPIGKISLGDYRTLVISMNKMFREGSGEIEHRFKSITFNVGGKNDSWTIYFNTPRYSNGWSNMSDDQFRPLCSTNII